jgi:hypothetical protein
MKEKKVQNSTAGSPARKLVENSVSSAAFTEMRVSRSVPKKTNICKRSLAMEKQNLIHSDAMLMRIYTIVRIQDFSFGYKIGSQILTLI